MSWLVYPQPSSTAVPRPRSPGPLLTSDSESIWLNHHCPCWPCFCFCFASGPMLLHWPLLRVLTHCGSSLLICCTSCFLLELPLYARNPVALLVYLQHSPFVSALLILEYTKGEQLSEANSVNTLFRLWLFTKGSLISLSKMGGGNRRFPVSGHCLVPVLSSFSVVCALKELQCLNSFFLSAA